MSTPPPQSLPFEIPTKDNPEFAALPVAVRRDVQLWAKRFSRIWNYRPITRAIRDLARVCDASYSTTLRKYYALRASSDWRSLISRREVPVMPLTVRVPLPRCGIRLKVIAHGSFEALIQIERISPTKGAAKE